MTREGTPSACALPSRSTGNEHCSAGQIAADFGVHPITLSKWLRRADTDEDAGPAAASGESAELREARKRIRLLEQENEVLRRAAAYLSQANLPAK
ncbi:transposase [Streptomyces violaceusniger]|uniref:Transposase n=1 Tax=Streptomyces violaceusniger TaxID=68280 RepID=A0A0X3VPV5_STRVO|nr:transposase [Streptomyces violaceusniger]